jgi:hypothetical protein
VGSKRKCSGVIEASTVRLCQDAYVIKISNQLS